MTFYHHRNRAPLLAREHIFFYTRSVVRHVHITDDATKVVIIYLTTKTFRE